MTSIVELLLSASPASRDVGDAMQFLDDAGAPDLVLRVLERVGDVGRDPVLLTRQIELELRDGDYRSALGHARALLKSQSLGDRQLRARVLALAWAASSLEPGPEAGELACALVAQGYRPLSPGSTPDRPYTELVAMMADPLHGKDKRSSEAAANTAALVFELLGQPASLVNAKRLAKLVRCT